MTVEEYLEGRDALKTSAALHTRDMLAGGPDTIRDFGDRKVNARIGAQWKKSGRLAAVDAAAKEVPGSMRATMRMHSKLERCK